MKNLTSLLLAISFLLATNYSVAKSNKVKKYYQGWGGPPEFRNDREKPRQIYPQNYYYLTFAGTASKKYIKRNSEPAMQSTCKDDANTNARKLPKGKKSVIK